MRDYRPSPNFVGQLLLLCLLSLCLLPACRSSESKETHKNSQNSTLNSVKTPSDQINNNETDHSKSFVSINDQNLTEPKATLQFRPSDFTSPNAPLIIAVHIQILGAKTTRLESENLEDRLMSLLNAHVPDPFVLQRARAIDNSQNVWGTLYLKFKRINIRLKRGSKTSSPINSFKFEFSLNLQIPSKFYSDWKSWTFEYSDEQQPDEYARVNAQFWDSLLKRMPTLVAVDMAQIQEWLRQNGLSAQLTSPDFKPLLHLPEHRYFPEGCLLLNEDGHYSIQYLSGTHSRALPVDFPNIQSLLCTSNAIYSAVLRSRRFVDFIFQPMGSPSAWKTSATFDNPLSENAVSFAAFDDDLCLYNAYNEPKSKFFKMICYDIKTGLAKWQHFENNSEFKAITTHNGLLYVAIDQNLLGFDNTGHLKKQLRWRNQTHHRIEKPLYCRQNQRLIYAPRLGKFMAANLEENTLDWELDTFAGHYLYCDNQQSIYIDEIGGYIVSINADTGKPRWKFHSGMIPLDTLSFAGKRFFLLKNAIYVLDDETGIVIMQIPLNFSPQRFIEYKHRVFLDTTDAIYEMTGH